MPTIAWAPHGHDDAIRRILPLIEVILLDSDDLPEPVDAFARAGDLSGNAYIVDLAWLRTTPWRERLAASYDLPVRRPRLARLAALDVCHREHSTASGLLLAGWLASRLGWERSAVVVRGRRAAARIAAARRRRGGGLDANARTGGAGARRRHARLTTWGPRCRCNVGMEGSTQPSGCPTAPPVSGRSSARPAARAGSSARASDRRCCATRPTGRRSTRRGSSARRDAVAGGSAKTRRARLPR